MDWRDKSALEDCMPENRRKGWREKETPTAAGIAQRFHEVSTENPTSHIPAVILHATREDLPLRKDIRKKDVILTYENAIDRAVSGYGLEGRADPLADHIVLHTAGDPRLRIPESYVYSGFEQALKQNNLQEAYFRFQSATKSVSHISMFTPQEIALLYYAATGQEDELVIDGVLKHTTTEHRLRDQIKPETIGKRFSGLLNDRQYAIDNGIYSDVSCLSKRPSGFFAAAAKRLLAYTVGDERLRAAIKPEGIEQLKTIYLEDQKGTDWSGRPGWWVEGAARDFNAVVLYTLDNPSAETLEQHRAHYHDIAYARRMEPIKRWHAHDILNALALYPNYQQPVLKAA